MYCLHLSPCRRNVHLQCLNVPIVNYNIPHRINLVHSAFKEARLQNMGFNIFSLSVNYNAVFPINIPKRVRTLPELPQPHSDFVSKSDFNTALQALSRQSTEMVTAIFTKILNISLSWWKMSLNPLPPNVSLFLLNNPLHQPSQLLTSCCLRKIRRLVLLPLPRRDSSYHG